MRKLIVGAFSLCFIIPAYATSLHADHIESEGSAYPVQNENKNTAGTGVQSSTLKVSDCWIRFMPGLTPSGAYFKVSNSGTHEAKLISMSVPGFSKVSLHRTINQGGISRMAAVEAIPISAGDSFEFRPGGYHAMLEKPEERLIIGSEVEARFEFGAGASATAQCSVKPPSALAH